MNCPCQPNVPCSQGKGYVLSEAEYRVCNGEGVTPEERIAFIKDLCTGKLMWDKENKLPSLLQQGVNFVAALAQHVAGGLQSADNETYQKRIAICKTCPKLRPDNRCSGCGCYMNLKASWDEQKCPDGKW